MISFFLPDAHFAIAEAAGVKALPHKTLACPFNVGDTITFPSAPNVVFRVVSRQYEVGASDEPGAWSIGLELSQSLF